MNDNNENNEITYELYEPYDQYDQYEAYKKHYNSSILTNRIVFFALGLFVGAMLTLTITIASTQIRNYLVWGSSLPPENKILEIYNVLDTHSIVPVDRNVLLTNMYRGLLEGVDDPYSYYFNSESLSVFMERTDGSYVGVGMAVILDTEINRVVITTVFTGAPAETAGLLPGDIIIAVDDTDTTTYSTDEVASLVRGVPDTDVTLRILRGDTILTFTITRRQVHIPTVSHRIIDDNIGYLRIESFDGVTVAQFSDAFDDLRSQNIAGLIIDVRNNPGGLLDTVISIGDILLPIGSIMYSEDSQGERTAYLSETDNILDIPLVMLVNGGSASASEVLTGAVRDHGVGVVVGEQTFGKGVVQRLFPLSDGSAIRATVARFYTPNGTSIHEDGITPDFIVEVDRETAMAAARLTLEEDIQLQKALQVVQGNISTFSIGG
ncbi:MAG: S41 family peptidase [Defluviitaleaceae bacterium]|nr:S41 family peptidase [Defluviitaleaceae bacterium]